MTWSEASDRLSSLCVCFSRIWDLQGVIRNLPNEDEDLHPVAHVSKSL